ncbi:MAG: cation diffusion facilitator family transporter [Promethearchaeota archaeon CR_4]|nr:MAG: cation diffusion facilitator family transporter [Candidatus Lokiarchaeota archaeon CR_4]
MKRQKKIFLACIVTFSIFFMELFGGILFGSVSLIADSYHVIMDVIALFTSYLALRMVLKPNWRADYSFGYHRLEVLAALFNGGTLSVTIFLIIQESIDRLLHPEPIEAGMIIIIAAIGLVANLISAKFLGEAKHNHNHDHNYASITEGSTEGISDKSCADAPLICPTDACSDEDVNIKSAYLHVLGDALSSVLVIVGAIIIFFTEITWIDPLLAFGIAAILFKGTYSVLKESLAAIMSKSPVDMGKVQKFLEQIPKVTNVHDLHIWRLCSRVAMLSAHVKLNTENLDSAEQIIEKIEAQLASQFNIQHVTIQLETPGTPVKACNICHD